MYFCTHKINKNEQNILLEVCDIACIYFGNGSDDHRITIISQ